MCLSPHITSCYLSNTVADQTIESSYFFLVLHLFSFTRFVVNAIFLLFCLSVRDIAKPELEASSGNPRENIKIIIIS